jgi:hypothetical protein
MTRILLEAFLCSIVALAPLMSEAHAQDRGEGGREEESTVPPSEPLPRTIQQRFAVKEGTLSLSALVTTNVRGDFYEQVGFGGALTYYPWEFLGLELRGVGTYSWLGQTGADVIARTGYLPDTRATLGQVSVGGRLSFGYGKVQLGDLAVVHFDPQLALHLGATFVDESRVLPTALLAFAVLLHFDYGIYAQLDLGMQLDVEDRGERGAVVSVGFSPLVAIGWRFGVGGGS